MARCALWPWFVALAAALVLGSSVPTLASLIGGELDPDSYRILTATPPAKLRAGERYTFVFGITAPEGTVRSTLRFCPSKPVGGSCRARSVRTLEVTDPPIWRSLGAAALPAGGYRGELALMAPTRLGTYRTVAHHVWNVDVR